MARYMVKYSYTADYVDALIQGGFVAREKTGRQLVQALGGEFGGLYWCQGDDDAYAILTLPDEASLNSMALGAKRTGFYKITINQIFTAEEMDSAAATITEVPPPNPS